MVNESDRERLGDGGGKRGEKELDQGIIVLSTRYTALPAQLRLTHETGNAIEDGAFARPSTSPRGLLVERSRCNFSSIPTRLVA